MFFVSVLPTGQRLPAGESDETSTGSKDHSGKAGGISKNDIVEEGDKEGGLLIAAHSFFLSKHISTSNRWPSPSSQTVDS